MGFYDSEENVEQYIRLAEGYDGKALIRRLAEYLPAGSTVLELGMGSGKDLELLQERYRATGSDSSALFVERYLRAQPNADVLLLNARTLKTERKFQAIYSNKVLMHLNYEHIRESFVRQSAVLETGGIALHSLWYGSDVEDFGGLKFHQLTEDMLRSMATPHFEVLEIARYTEMEEKDSLYGVLKCVENIA